MRTSPIAPSVIHHSFFVLRTPLLPLSGLLKSLNQTDDSSRLTLLATLLQKPNVLEALQVASPRLFSETQNWLNQAATTLSDAVEAALWRYVLRMSSRCTPFGLFAGYSTGQVAEQTNVLFDAARMHASSRLDTEVLAVIIHRLLTNPSVREISHYTLNNSLYRAGSQYRYSERIKLSNTGQIQLTSIEADEGVQVVVGLFKDNKRVSFSELIRTVEALGYPQRDCLAFINQLIDSQLLLSEWELMATGLSNSQRIAEQIIGAGVHVPELDLLKKINGLLTHALPSIGQYKLIHQLLKPILLAEQDTKSILQVDTRWRTETSTLKKSIVTQLGQQLVQLMPIRHTRHTDALTAFRQRFYDRFGEQPVPLLTALDYSLGVGYGQPSSGISLFNKLAVSITATDTPIVDHLDVWRLTKFTQALQTERMIVDLTDDDLAQATHSAPTIPPACSWYAHGTLISSDTASIDQGNYQFVLRSAAGPSALNLLGRFATGDTELTTALQHVATWEQEQQPNVLFAEVAHLPTERAGNVVCRPTLRPFEIPYLTHSSVDGEHTISLNELTISVPGGQSIILFCERLGKRVIPRLSTAHSYHLGDDVYRFLGDLQHQDQTLQLSWSWGVLHDQPFLPRVVYKQLILARAQWLIRFEELAEDVNAPTISTLRQARNLPRLIAIVEGDNELLLDLDVLLCQRLLYTELVRKGTVRVVEWLAGPESCWVHDGTDRFTSEVIIPFGLPDMPTLLQGAPARFSTGTLPQRTFLPGTEWVYIKLYASEQSTDELLTMFVKSFVECLFDQQLVTSWFFIRYADPEPHLRLRLYCPEQPVGQVLDLFNRVLAQSPVAHYVHKVVIDSYERELERYGPATIEACEKLFCDDSQFVIDCLSEGEDSTNEDDRCLMACQSVNALLTSFGLSLIDKKNLLSQLQQRFFEEHGGSKQLKKQLNDQYRFFSTRLKLVLTEEQSEIEHGDYVDRLLRCRSTKIQPLVVQIRYLLTTNSTNSPTLSILLSSLIHMAINRIFSSQQRKAELLVYHFLARHYASTLAKAQNNAGR